MGAKLASIFVTSEEQDAVVSAVKHVLATLSSSPPAIDLPARALWDAVGVNPWGAQYPVAYVSPSIGGWIGVYDSFSEGAFDFRPDIAVGLSQALNTVAIGFQLYDGDVLRYFLANKGRVIDKFDSAPGNLGYTVTREDRRALRGNPRILADTCGRPDVTADLRECLRHYRDDPYELLDQLAARLGLPNAFASYGLLLGEPVVEVDHRERFTVITRADLEEASRG